MRINTRILALQIAIFGLVFSAATAAQNSWPVQADGGGTTRLPNGNPIRFGLGPRALPSYDFHGGIDIPANEGTPVFAVADGVVSGVNSSAGTGTSNQIIVDHGSGRFTVYDHLSDSDFPLVAVGTPVVSGLTRIGSVGDSGAAAGNFHLHLTYIVAPAGSGYTGTRSNERFARSPLEFLPHNATRPSEIQVELRGTEALVSMPVSSTITRIELSGEGQSRTIDYYDILAQGSVARNNQLQGGLRLSVTRPTLPTEGRVTLTLNTDGGVPFTPTAIVLRDFNGRVVYSFPDTQPDPFAFLDLAAQPTSSLVQSNAILVTGINAATAISVVGGEYSIGCTATFTGLASTISNGESVCVRHRTAATGFTGTHTILTIGGVSDTFSSITGAGPSRSHSAPSPTGTGTITASFSGGGAGCRFNRRQYIPVMGHSNSPPAGTSPVGITFPHGLFDFTTTDCDAGSVITMIITYPQPLPSGTLYWKYGPTPTNASPHWYVLPARIEGNQAEFNIRDGELGDDDLIANGQIIDQGGPGVGGGAAVNASVPTLSFWLQILIAIILLAGILRVNVKAA